MSNPYKTYKHGTTVLHLTDRQKEIADQLKFKFLMHVNYAKGGELQHKAEYKGMNIIRMTWTPKRNGVWGKGTATYFIDKEKKEYKTPIELLDELDKRTLKTS